MQAFRPGSFSVFVRRALCSSIKCLLRAYHLSFLQLLEDESETRRAGKKEDNDPSQKANSLVNAGRYLLNCSTTFLDPDIRLAQRRVKKLH